MKALFNGTCTKCDRFTPGCAHVFMRRDGKAAVYSDRPITLCPDCRKAEHGRYRADDKHK